MKLHHNFLAAMCVLLTLALVGVTANTWVSMRGYHAMEDQLKSNIAEMARLDEILSSSALLATATGENAHHQRYEAHVDKLDDAIKAALSTFGSAHVDAMLRETETANRWLVNVERGALAASTAGPAPDAYALLRSDDYSQKKAAYQAGLDATMGALGSLAESKREGAKRSLMLVGLLCMAAAAAFARILMGQRMERRAMRQQNEQMHLMKGLIGTFMDLQNNLLNNMVYFRTKAAHGLQFDEEDVRLIDKEIECAKGKLSEIADTGIGSTRDLGGITVIETETTDERAAA